MSDREKAPPPRRAIPTDWILLTVLIVGLTAMLVAIGTSGPKPEAANGSRMAVGMTPTDQAIMVQLTPCGTERVESISLLAAESDLVLWEATSINPDERFTFVVGQPPRTFIETVPMIETLPRGAVLEARITTDTVHSVQFLFANLLPDLWSYAGTYHPDSELQAAISAAAACPTSVAPASSTRRIIIVLGFLVAAGAGAGLLARRLVSPEI